MSGLIPGFPYNGVVTVNRVILKSGYSVDDLQERVAVLCENVKTYHSDTGFVGGFVALNSGDISNEGSTVGQAVVPGGAGAVRERQRGDRLRDAVVRQGLQPRRGGGRARRQGAVRQRAGGLSRLQEKGSRKRGR